MRRIIRVILVAGLAVGAGAAEDRQEGTRDPAELALLATLGRREVPVHDPSTIIPWNGGYRLFATGRGIPTWRSADLQTWSRCPPVFDRLPGWTAGIASEPPTSAWAPDALRIGGRVLLFYSVSAFGRNTSAIGLATSTAADPDAPGAGWTDQGPVVRSAAGDDFNAIDPAPFLDADGRLWLAFGSFWSGIKLVELDPATGHRRPGDQAMHALAWQQEIEAPALCRHGDWYYLFVNWGKCCRGVDSTYQIRVGRSRAITGPYQDRDGVLLIAGGGSPFLASQGPFIGPGHVGIVARDGQELVSVHFYDRSSGGRGTLALRPLRWSGDGWPVAGTWDGAPPAEAQDR